MLKNETLTFLVFFVITTFASMTVPNKTNVTQEKTRVRWSVFGVPCSRRERSSRPPSSISRVSVVTSSCNVAYLDLFSLSLLYKTPEDVLF